MIKEVNNIYEIVNQYLELNEEEKITFIENNIDNIINFYSTLAENTQSKDV